VTPERKAELRAAQARRRERTDDALLATALALLDCAGTFTIAGVAEGARCSVGRVYFGRYSSQLDLTIDAISLYLERLTSPDQLSGLWARLIFRHALRLEEALERARVRLDMVPDYWYLHLARVALSKSR
jgi:hypothetical protein